MVPSFSRLRCSRRSLPWLCVAGSPNYLIYPGSRDSHARIPRFGVGVMVNFPVTVYPDTVAWSFTVTHRALVEDLRLAYLPWIDVSELFNRTHLLLTGLYRVGGRAKRYICIYVCIYIYWHKGNSLSGHQKEKTILHRKTREWKLNTQEQSMPYYISFSFSPTNPHKILQCTMTGREGQSHEFTTAADGCMFMKLSLCGVV